MAKKQITATSSPIEIRTAQEQIAKAQQEFKILYQQKYSGKAFNAAELQRDAAAIAAKYDYVDYGQPPSVGNEINIGGDQYFVKGLNNQTNTSNFPPEAKTVVNADDAFPVSKPRDTAITPNTNPKANNPNQAKIDQSIVNEAAPQSAIESTQVQPSTNNENLVGNKDATEAGAALDRTNKTNPQNQNGIVNQNPNELPTSSNLPGRLSDEYLKEPAVANSNKRGNSDDAASLSKPMGTAIGGFVNVDDVNISPDPTRPSNTGGVTIGSTTSIPVPKSSKAGTNNKPGIEVRPNLLHEFANWTYTIAWYMLPTDTYNSVIRTGNIGDTGTLIAKSGGVGSKLDQAMAGDVYFRNLRFTSVIGNRRASAATNNFELEMTVVEPYGASLIAELAAMALNMTGESSVSPAEVPYLLEIDFAGYQDDGTPIPSILGTRSKGKKYIPVKILSIEMKLESAGSVYTISMAPYSYFAQTARYADMEFATTLKGKQVIEMLGRQGNGLMAQLNLNEQKKVRKGIIKYADEYNIDLYSFTSNGSSDQSMSISPFTYPQNGGDSTVAKVRPADNDPTMGVFNVGAGNIIKDVIKNVVLSSQYFNEKVKPASPNDTSIPAELIKIIPVIEVMKDKFDPARNEFAKKITFKVFNTLNFGEIFPYVGNAPVSDWGYSKIYNWLFTGKNEDVITVDLAFQFIYFVEMQSNIEDYNKIQLQSPSFAQRVTVEQVASKRSSATKAGPTSNTGGNMPERYINSTIAAEWFDSKMMSNTGDNIAVNMQIIGDPDWIPQDASLRGGSINVGNNLYDRHGSIAVDVAGVYVKLQLRTPRDYNPKTGVMDLRLDNNIVEGVYQVITVESNFENGKFTQTLSMVKVPNQEEEKVGTAGAGGGINANPTEFGGPR